MTENGLPLMVLCHLDGRVVTADRETAALLGDAEPAGTEEATISQVAAKANCADLASLFDQFVTEKQASAVSFARGGGEGFQVTLRQLNGFHSSPLVAVEICRLDKSQGKMVEIGRAAERLIHDFKNQMGGLKLYAAYLKKRYAANPDWAEGREIADKIINSLNEMTENAQLINKLTRPLPLKFAEEDFAALVKQSVDEFQPRAASRELKVNVEMDAVGARFPLDVQQMRVALQTLLERAAELSPAGAALPISLRTGGGRLELLISTRGESLSEQHRESLFNFLTNERLNPGSLKMALARRIIELHGGRVSAQVAEPSGTNILLKFRS